MQRRGDQPASLQHLQGALILAQAVGQRAVELQPVAVRAHAAVAQQVARILMAEQVFAGGHGPGVELRQRRLQRIVQRIAGLLVPEQRIVAQHFGVGDRGLQIEAAIGVHRELRLTADFLQHRLNALAVLVERGAADLHLHHGVAAVEIAAHLGAQSAEVLAGIVVAACRVDKNARIGLHAVPLGQQPEQRLARNLRHRVPHRHVDGADRHGALAMPAGLLVAHQRGPDAVGIEVVAGIVQQRLRLGLQEARSEALADQPPWP